MIKRIKKLIPVSFKDHVKVRIQYYQHEYLVPFQIRNKTKIFCIGRNKTGTTSFKKAMEDLGFVLGNQRIAEKELFYPYYNKDFKPIIKYCKTAQVFQDFPFSMPETYKYLDKAFSGSKFILTIRDNPEQWYKSLTSFHAKLWGKNGRIPTKEDLQNATYIWKGRPWEARVLAGAKDDEPYNREDLIKSYVDFNNGVIEYFKNRPEDLLVINLSEKNSYSKMVHFLDIKNSPFNSFPWENKTSSLDYRN